MLIKRVWNSEIIIVKLRKKGAPVTKLKINGEEGIGLCSCGGCGHLPSNTSNVAVFDGTALFKFPLDAIPVDPIEKRVGKRIKGDGCVFRDECPLMVTGLELVIGIDSVRNLESNVTDASSVIRVENRNLHIPAGLVIEKEFEVEISDFVLEKDDIDAAGLEASIDTKAVVGNVGIVHGSVGISGRDKAQDFFIVLGSHVNVVVDNDVDVGNGGNPKGSVGSDRCVLGFEGGDDGGRRLEVFNV